MSRFPMRSRLLLLAVPVLLALAALAAPVPFQVDPVHTSVVFRVGHMGISYVYGRFDDVSGGFTYDADQPANSKVEMTAKAASVDTRVAMRDNDLKANYFQAPQFPDITFKSTSVKAGDNGLDVTGDLTLHGMTKSITIHAVKTGQGTDRQGKARVGFETTFTLKRSDYGMTHGLPGAGDEVTMMIAVEAAAQ